MNGRFLVSILKFSGQVWSRFRCQGFFLVRKTDRELCSLEHPYPALAVSSTAYRVGDHCFVSVGDFALGVYGTIVSLSQGLFLNRELLDSEFLLCILWMNPAVYRVPLTVQHPSGQNFVHKDIPLERRYIFRKSDITYLSFQHVFIPVLNMYFLRANGYAELPV